MRVTRLSKHYPKSLNPLLLSIVLLVSGSAWGANLEDSFRFVNPVPRPGLSSESEKPEAEIEVWIKWTEEEKRQLTTTLEEVYNIVPGLIERATARGIIRVYRSSYAKGEGPLASANIYDNSLTFTDKFFSLRETGWILTLAHELAHLADPGHVNVLSDEWDQLVRAQCERIVNKLSKAGIRLSYGADWGYIEKTYGDFARTQGMPSVYACVNWNETLAENVEAIMLKNYQMPKPIRSFIFENYIKSPYKALDAVTAYLKADELVRERRTDQAIAEYTRLLSAYPELKGLYYARGKARQESRDLKGALADYDKAIEIYRRSERKRLVSGIYSIKAELSRQQGEYKAAIAAYGRALEFAPGWIENHFERGKLLLEKVKDPRRAIADFDAILQIRPSSIPVYLARAKAWQQLGEYRKMDADFEAAIKIRPDFSRTYYQRALAYQDLGRYKQAISDFSRVIEFKDHLIDRAYLQRGKCKEELKDFLGAIADYNALAESVKRWSRYPVVQVLSARARAYLRAGQRDKALKDYAIFLQRTPGGTVPFFTEWIELYPNDYTGYVYRGLAFIKGREKKPNRAIADLNKAIAIDPRNWLAYYYRSVVYEYQGNTTAAIEDMKEAARLNPEKKELAQRIKFLMDKAQPH